MTQTKMAKRRQRAFTFLELLIVMEIIMVLAGMAIPYIRTANKAANEQSAVSAMRTLSSAQELYRPRQSPQKYAPDLAALQAAGLIDSNLGTGAKAGYSFKAVGLSTTSEYAFTAAPNVPGSSGDRWFFVDESGVIRMSETDVVNETSDPLE